MSKDFASAKKAYLRGDKRKLADFVRANNTMTDEQAEFIAQAIAGDVKVQDGRTEKPWTRTLLFEYGEIKLNGDLKTMLFGDIGEVKDAEIYRALAERHGYSDESAVKKAIARAQKRRHDEVEERLAAGRAYNFEASRGDEYLDHLYLMKKEGRDRKLVIPAAVVKSWMDENADLIPPDDFVLTDLVIDVDFEIEHLEAQKKRDTT